VASLVAGCPDPEGRFDEFGERYDALDPQASSSSGPVGDCTIPEVGGDADGKYLFALSAQLVPNKPILFEATVAVVEGAAGPELKLSLTPLGTPYRAASGEEVIPVLEPVQPPFDLGSYPINPDGTFDAELPKLQVAGKANPFSPNDLEAVVVLHGQVCAEPERSGSRLGLICGSMEGDVSKPIELALKVEKNAFTFTRYDETFPVDFTYNCAGDVAFPVDGE